MQAIGQMHRISAERCPLFARPLGGWPWGPLEKAAGIQPVDAKAHA